MNTKDIGDLSQTAVMLALMKSGKHILMPYGDNRRYDLVMDEDGTFLRIQVKTGRLKDGAIIFNSSSSYAHRGGGSKNYRGEIEYFGIYCPALDKSYLVPVDDAGIGKTKLRVTDPKNNQRKRVKLASDYKI